MASRRGGNGVIAAAASSSSKSIRQVWDLDTPSTDDSTDRAHIKEDDAEEQDLRLKMISDSGMPAMLSSSSIKVEISISTCSSEGHSGRDQLSPPEVRTTQRKKKAGQSKKDAAGSSGSEVLDSADTLSTGASVSTGRGRRHIDDTTSEGGRSSKRDLDLGMPGSLSSIIKVEVIQEGERTTTRRNEVLDSETVSTGGSKPKVNRGHIREAAEDGISSISALRIPRMLSSINGTTTTAGSSEGHTGVDQQNSEVRTTQRKKKIRRRKSPKRNVLSKASQNLQRRLPRRHDCVFCEKSFSTVQALNDHLRRSIGEHPVRHAGNRGRCCSHRSQGSAHVKESHFGKKSTIRLYTCHICGKSVKGSLAGHLRVHTGERRFPCQMCPKKLSTGYGLKLHVMSVHAKDKRFTCSICDKGFTCSGHLGNHIRTHTKEKPYTCVMCGKGFSLYGTLVSHLRVHTQERPYFCRVCKKEFKQVSDLPRHLRIHTQERPFKCEICSRGFNQRGDLNSHMRTHTKEKPYQCSQCRKAFAYQWCLTCHMKKEHAQGEPFFDCVFCGKEISQSSNLMTHIRQHIQEKPYFCKVCKKEFTGHTSMTDHVRLHTRVKPFKFRCGVCRKGFFYRHHLVTHLRGTHKMSPFNCSECGKPFAYQVSLRFHLKTAHGLLICGRNKVGQVSGEVALEENSA